MKLYVAALIHMYLCVCVCVCARTPKFLFPKSQKAPSAHACVA